MKLKVKKIGKSIAQSERNRLIFSVLLVAIIFTLTFLVFSVKFETNDDSAIMYTIAGYRTGSPAGYNVLTGGLFGFPVSWLYMLFPGLPWYSLILIFSNFLGNVCVLKSFMKFGRKSGIRIVGPVLIYLFLYLTCIMYYIYQIQFTVVTATAGAGACAVLFARQDDDTRRVRVSDTLLFVFLIFIGVSLRVTTGYLVAAFVSALLVRELFRYFKDGKNRKVLKQLLIYSCIFIIMASVSFAFETVYESVNSVWTDYRVYNSQRVRYMDYPGVTYDEAPEVYNEAGWSADLYILSRSWFFLDERVNADSLGAINEYADSVRSDRTDNAKSIEEAYNRFIVVSAGGPYLLAAILFVGMLSLVSAALLLKQKKVLDAIWVLGIQVAFISFMLYFGIKGRLNMRVEYALFQLVAVTALMFFMRAWGRRETAKSPKKGKKVFLRIVAVLCLVMALASSGLALVYYVGNAENAKQVAASSQTKLLIEAYAIKHSENIYIYDITLALSGYVFTVYPDEVPNNIFLYGGSTVFSPLHDAQLESLGLDELYADQFFDDNIYFMSCTYPNEYNALVSFMMRDYGAAGAKIMDLIDGKIYVYKLYR